MRADRSLTKLVVRRRLRRVMTLVFRDSDISPTLTRAFEEWVNQYSNKDERELIASFAMSYLLDTERRLRNIRDKLNSGVFSGRR